MVLAGEDIQFLQTYGIKILISNCEPSAAKDKSLPRNTYLVKCVNEDDQWYDIVMGCRFDIFDAYYDRFGNVIKKMSWTEGTINPKMWGEPKPKVETKKRR